MKKYHRLVLLIISVISISLFLVYRHEYNRLHYVLEVFNFFGQPCNFSDLQNSDRVLNHHDWGPTPYWQEVDNSFIYSAFITDKIEVKTIALQTDNKSTPKNCYFWFEEKKKPIIGKLKYTKISNDENAALTTYFYICSLPNVENVPYAVSFSFKIKKDNEMKKILLTNTMGHDTIYNTTICVSPSVYSKKRLFEFLSFHKLIGIESFIFYDRDIPHRIAKLITNLANRLAIQSVFLPWNYPKTDGPLTRTIIENDCLLRTTGHTNYSVTLEINEYIVPIRASSFQQLINTIGSNSDRLALPVQKFCINNINMNRPIALQNFEVADDFNYNVVRYVHKSEKNKNVITTNAIDNTQAAIHKYVKCNLEPHKTHTDKSITKYSTDFTRATLVQLLIHDQI